MENEEMIKNSTTVVKEQKKHRKAKPDFNIFKKGKKLKPPKYKGLIGEEPLVVAANSTTGSVSSSSSEVIVVGTVNGDVSSTIAVLIEPSGRVTGKVTAPSIESEGYIGNGFDAMVASLSSISKTNGLVRVSSLTMDRGAFVKGDVIMGKWSKVMPSEGKFTPYNANSEVDERILDGNPAQWQWDEKEAGKAQDQKEKKAKQKQKPKILAANEAAPSFGEEDIPVLTIDDLLGDFDDEEEVSQNQDVSHDEKKPPEKTPNSDKQEIPQNPKNPKVVQALHPSEPAEPRVIVAASASRVNIQRPQREAKAAPIIEQRRAALATAEHRVTMQRDVQQGLTTAQAAVHAVAPQPQLQTIATASNGVQKEPPQKKSGDWWVF